MGRMQRMGRYGTLLDEQADKAGHHGTRAARLACGTLLDAMGRTAPGTKRVRMRAPGCSGGCGTLLDEWR